ncbi:uncharacterized protein LOC114866166 [Betta splendens]|uniref:Uncharacterized protein LOC114866166 n=1 Tax=Betta splendens TaxID=158456 RepID=A0A9W2Y4Q2_BETSP|nr:uncharacterized protein LOC114866166 [Betta splendens]
MHWGNELKTACDAQQQQVVVCSLAERRPPVQVHSQLFFSLQRLQRCSVAALGSWCSMCSGVSVRSLLFSLLFAGQLATAFRYRRADPDKANAERSWTFPQRHQPALLRSRVNAAQHSLPDGSSEALSPAVGSVGSYGRLKGGSRMVSRVFGYRPGSVTDTMDLWRFVLPPMQKGNLYPLGVVSSHAIRMTSGHQSEAKAQQPNPPSQHQGFQLIPAGRTPQPSFPALIPQLPGSSNSWAGQAPASPHSNRFHTGVASSRGIVMRGGPRPEAQDPPARTQSKAGKWDVPWKGALGSVAQLPDFLPRVPNAEAAGYRAG